MSAQRVGSEALDRLARLESTCFDAPWTRESLSSWLASPHQEAWVATDAPAYALVSGLPPEAELLRIGVEPEARGRGHALRLLEQILAELRQRSFERLFLEVSALNRSALALYRGLGARPVGQRPRYHADGSDALLLVFDLAESRD